MDRISKTVLHLIIINTIVLILTALNEKGLFLPQINIVGTFALHYFENPNFHWWQYISYMFMHADFTHLLFNMYALWAFGTPLENIWGRNKFLFFYFSCGVGAAFYFRKYYRRRFRCYLWYISGFWNVLPRCQTDVVLYPLPYSGSLFYPFTRSLRLNNGICGRNYYFRW